MDIQEPNTLNEDASGLFAVGTVVGRRKKVFDNGNEVVSYTLNCGNKLLSVDVWNPPNILTMGAMACLNCHVRMFTTKSGKQMCSLVADGIEEGF